VVVNQIKERCIFNVLNVKGSHFHINIYANHRWFLFVYNDFDTQSLQLTQAHLYYLQLELAQMLFNAKK